MKITITVEDEIQKEKILEVLAEAEENGDFLFAFDVKVEDE